MKVISLDLSINKNKNINIYDNFYRNIEITLNNL